MRRMHSIVRTTLFSVSLLGTFLGASLLSATVTAAAAFADSSVYITVRETKLRSKADFFSAGTMTLRYGDKLNVVQESAPWYQVRTGGGAEGYVHQSAITTRKVVLDSSAKFNGSQPDQNDVVLAGKGFSADVEKQFASSHRNLNFADVNAMERIKVSPQELQSFVKQGQLDKKGS